MDIQITIQEVHVHLGLKDETDSIAEQIETGIFKAIMLAQDANKLAFHANEFTQYANKPKEEVKPLEPIAKDTYEQKGEQHLSADVAKNECVECGTQFIPKKSKLEKFCSENCKKAYTRKYNREWAQNKKKKELKPAENKNVQNNERPARIIPSGMTSEELVKQRGGR